MNTSRAHGRTNGLRPSDVHATLGPSLSITGDIYAQQDLLVRGTITGNLDLPDHSLTIAPEGRVDRQRLRSRGDGRRDASRAT